MKNVDDAYAEFNVVHSQLITIVPEEVLQEQEEVYIDFEEQYYHVRSTIDDLLNAHETHPATSQQPFQPLSAPVLTVIDNFRSDRRKLFFPAFADNNPTSTPAKLQEDRELPSHEEPNFLVQENFEFTPQRSQFSLDQPKGLIPRLECLNRRSSKAYQQPPKKDARDLHLVPKNNISDQRIVCSSKSQAAVSSISCSLADSSKTENRQPAATATELQQPINVNAVNQPRKRQASNPLIKKELKAHFDSAEKCPEVFPSVVLKPNRNDKRSDHSETDSQQLQSNLENDHDLEERPFRSNRQRVFPTSNHQDSKQQHSDFLKSTIRAAPDEAVYLPAQQNPNRIRGFPYR